MCDIIIIIINIIIIGVIMNRMNSVIIMIMIIIIIVRIKTSIRVFFMIINYDIVSISFVVCILFVKNFTFSETLFGLQEHDSYRAFRTHNLNMSLSFETKPILKETEQVEGQIVEPVKVNPDDQPNCVFYASTLRWMDNVKVNIFLGHSLVLKIYFTFYFFHLRNKMR